MKHIITLLILTCSTVSFTQQGWQVEFKNNPSFIQNKGQFDAYALDKIGAVKYCADFGKLRVLFGEKGVQYHYLDTKKVPKSEREAIMADSTLSHAEKERLVRKFTYTMDNICMTWEGMNSATLIKGINERSDYHNYAVKDPATGEVRSINRLSGFESLIYKDIYPNIDILYEFHELQGIKYSVILHPGADPHDVQMLYDRDVELEDGQLVIPGGLEDLIEHEPVTFYADQPNSVIESHFLLQDNTVSFNLGNYDNTKEVVIDPWVISATLFTTSSAAWEVETDGAGNVYVIGGETPMQLRKYNSGGSLLWTYTTPWDTASVWLGTLATDVNGVSYITSGTTPELERITTGGGMVWHISTPFAGGLLTEFWSISFNCDNTKLIVGGTAGGFNPTPAIYDIDITNGNINAYQTFTPGSLFSPTEVRSISWSKNAQYIYLTHKQVGAINQNIGFCPDDVPIYELPNNMNLSYKCENYLPATQNGGGLKALVANDLYFYTHEGDAISRWDLTTGAFINNVALPGGSVNNGFGGAVVRCSGLSVDDCGNIYAGSMDRVVKYDANLNILSQVNVNFNVYDVCVNSNSEVLAVGAQQNNGSASRNGRIESVAMSSCAKYSLVCCESNICPATFCENDPPEALVTYTAGGTWSGPGVNASGVFDPASVGIGNWAVTYTLPCGSSTVLITVIPCNAPISVCEETNGTLSASGGDGNYSWYEETNYWDVDTSAITGSFNCNSCPYGSAVMGGFLNLIYQYCEDPYGNTITECYDSTWVAGWSSTPYATGINTAPPASYPIIIIDGVGDSFVINDATELTDCVITPLAATMGEFEMSCFGDKAKISWSSLSENNSSHFELERGNSEGVFTQIGIIPANGNSSSEIFYSYVDNNRPNELAIYKLYEVDLSGDRNLIRTESLDCSDDAFRVYPNPFNDQITIELGDLLINSNGTLEVYNYNGQLVDTKALPKNVAKVHYTTNFLAKGVYLIKVVTDNSTRISKLIKR